MPQSVSRTQLELNRVPSRSTYVYLVYIYCCAIVYEDMRRSHNPSVTDHDSPCPALHVQQHLPRKVVDGRHLASEDPPDVTPQRFRLATN